MDTTVFLTNGEILRENGDLVIRNAIGVRIQWSSGDTTETFVPWTSILYLADSRPPVESVESPPRARGLTPDQERELRLYADGRSHSFAERPDRNLIRRNLLTYAPEDGRDAYRITPLGQTALRGKEG